jgi:nucleoside-diphosphate-sugar epimerase
VIVVTGAGGHLGQWVVAALTRAGHDVLCLSRRPADRPTIRGLAFSRPVRTVGCDLADAASVAAAAPALAEARAVVHLAACIPGDTARNTDEDALATLRANVLGTAHLLGALARAPHLQGVVYASTFEVYGTPETQPVAEDHPTRPASHYGASKLAGEKYLQLFDDDRGVACAALRLPAIYGPGETIRRALGNFVRAAAEGRALEIHGDGADRRELVHAADAADAVLRALERRARGVFNVGSGSGPSIREMAEAVRRAAGGSVEIAMRPRVKPRLDYMLAIDHARRELGWEPRTTLDEGVRTQLAWVRGEDWNRATGPV